MIKSSIDKSDINLIEELAKGVIDKEQFCEQTNFKPNYSELKELLFLEQRNVDKENNNARFRNLFYYMPHILSKSEEALLNGELLLVDWHHEHEEIVSGFQVFYKNYDKSVEILVQAFKNVPNYINNIPELKQSYQRKIVYALTAQESSLKIVALKQLLNEDVDDVVNDLIRRKLEFLS